MNKFRRIRLSIQRILDNFLPTFANRQINLTHRRPASENKSLDSENPEQLFIDAL